MNLAEEKFEALKALVSEKTGLKIDQNLHRELSAAIVTEYDEEDHDDNFRDFLAVQHGATVEIAGVTYDIGSALKLVDSERYFDELREFLNQTTVACGFYRFYEDQIDLVIKETERATKDQIIDTICV